MQRSSAAAWTSASIARRSSLRLVELGGDRAGFVGVARGEQANAEIGTADAAAGIDPRAQREAQIGAGRRAREARCLDQRVQADIAALRHHLQPLRDEGAVEALQRGDIGNGAERDEIEQVEQPRFGARP